MIDLLLTAFSKILRPAAPVRACIASLACFAITALAGCYAEPREEDLQRVKEDFLTLRFVAPFREEFRGMNDEQLFAMSCQNNRVQCDEIRAMLKAEDPEFYRILTGEAEKIDSSDAADSPETQNPQSDGDSNADADNDAASGGDA